MNDENKAYDPAEDENQGVVQRMAQVEKASAGTPQTGGLNPEPLQDSQSGQPADEENVNDELLTEEEVAKGSIGMESE
ncbi:hypothetical protein [Spirosoma koreense]